MRTLTSRFAPVAAAVVALASAGCASAQHPATSSAAAGSTAPTGATDGATPSAADSSSGGTAATTPAAPAAGTASSVPKPVVPPASTRPSVPHSPPSTPLPVDPPRTAVPAATVTATTQLNGGTVHVPLGGTLSLVGFPSNWQPQTTDPAVLVDPPLPVDPALCKTPPGVPCQLPPLNYKAMTKGTVKVTAHRTQCGEARPCTPPDSYDFTLTVVVG